MLYHSLVSDWNHGNAHFLRGVVTELQDAGHTVDVYEPEDGWSRRNLVAAPHELARDAAQEVGVAVVPVRDERVIQHHEAHAPISLSMGRLAADAAARRP